ncbi:MAG: alpha/beta hydrolase [Actinomycetota bacterium]|nr:alpha/beta hydrolase [Actinomycetota bacterium]
MHVETVGDDEAPDLVLLHGGIGTGRYHWSKLVEALSARYRLHLPDLPGHGRTPLPESADYGRQLQVDAIVEYLEGLNPPLHTAGFSMGGHACLALAGDRPELFSSLTLVGVSVREHEGLRDWRRNFDPDELESDYPLWARQLSKLHAPLGDADSWKEVCRRDATGLEVDVDVEGLAVLGCPVLLVRGDRDPGVDPAHYAELRSVWPQADELVVPAGRHDVQLTRHRLVEPALLDFLERASEAAS